MFSPKLGLRLRAVLSELETQTSRHPKRGAKELEAIECVRRGVDAHRVSAQVLARHRATVKAG